MELLILMCAVVAAGIVVTIVRVVRNRRNRAG